jgi:hypothetical protein
VKQAASIATKSYNDDGLLFIIKLNKSFIALALDLYLAAQNTKHTTIINKTVAAPRDIE